MFANAQKGGKDVGGPDVCLTPAPPGPPVPLPYPNMAQGPMASPPVTKVLLDGTPAHNLGSSVPQTSGDNSGINTGVASGTVMAPARHLTGAFTVLFGGKPASRLTSTTLQNSTNCPGARIQPSQTKVMLLAS